MLKKFSVSVNIKNTPREIFKYASDPINWTASNPDEHLGLKYFNKKNRPETGVLFHQMEKVAGIYNDLRGHIVYMNTPNVLVWRGLAKYKLLGPLFTYHLAEGGVIRIEKTKDGSKMSHAYYIDFPDSIIGRIINFYFTLRGAREKLIKHGNRELEFFKEKLESKKQRT